MNLVKPSDKTGKRFPRVVSLLDQLPKRLGNRPTDQLRRLAALDHMRLHCMQKFVNVEMLMHIVCTRSAILI